MYKTVTEAVEAMESGGPPPVEKEPGEMPTIRLVKELTKAITNQITSAMRKSVEHEIPVPEVMAFVMQAQVYAAATTITFIERMLGKDVGKDFQRFFAERLEEAIQEQRAVNHENCKHD